MIYASPISEEIVRAAATCDCRLTATPNQVGPCGYAFGYDELARLRHELRMETMLERDHLGRAGEDFDEWIDRDWDHGFSAFHLHVFDADVALNVIERHRTHPTIEWQIGPGEDDSKPVSSTLWKDTARVASWFSAPLGIRIVGTRNTHDYKREFSRDALKHGVAFRAHNCDYLNDGMLPSIKKWYPGINIGPQLGVVQSLFYMTRAKTVGCSLSPWLFACYADRKQLSRWGNEALAVGHYHFNRLDAEFRRANRDDCVSELVKVIKRYE